MPPIQPVRREADRYETRVAYEMTEWRKKSPARASRLLRKSPKKPLVFCLFV
jgi:hypothetical protein